MKGDDDLVLVVGEFGRGVLVCHMNAIILLVGLALFVVLKTLWQGGVSNTIDICLLNSCHPNLKSIGPVAV